MKRLTVQEKIDRVQTSINNLFHELNNACSRIKTKSIQKRILKLYEELYVLEAQSKDTVKICPVCKKEFIASRGKSVCCSTKCYNHYYYLQKTIAKRQRMRETKPLKEIICKECGKTFLAKTLKNKFCSEECKKVHTKKYGATYRETHKERMSKLQAKYRKTEKYKITRKKYTQSEKGKSALKKYQQSEKYKTYIKEYRKSESYKEVVKRYLEKRKQNNLESNKSI